jgi:hypothetical protein
MADGVEITALTIPTTVMYEGTDCLVTAIGDNAFSGYAGLTALTLPSTLTSVGANAFYNCTGLTSVRFPLLLTAIGDNAFSGCTALTLPSTLTSVGTDAFAACTALTSVTLRPTTPPTLGEGAFAGISTDCAFTCPAQALESYRASARAPYFTPEGEPEPAEPEQFNVTFRQGDDVLYQTIVSRGSAIPAVPVLERREGFTLYWFEAPDSSAIRNFSTPVTADLTLYPIWIPDEPSTPAESSEPSEPSEPAEPSEPSEPDPDDPSLSIVAASLAPVEAALYDLRGQLLRRAAVTLPATPSALRTALGVPAGLYILATPDGTRKVKL